MQHKSHTHGFDVIHPNIANANPGVIKKRNNGGEGQKLHPLGSKDTCPLFVTDRAAGENDLRQNHDGECCHQGGGYALRQPVANAVMRADDNALGTVIN